MDLIELIQTRRSIRKYSDKDVSEKLILEILHTGVSAPSAGNQQPWQFLIIDDNKILKEIPELLPNAFMMNNANKAILVCADLDMEKHKNYFPCDCSAATQNILLAAHAKGIGSCWCGIWPREERILKVRKFFDMPNSIIPFSIISLGYPLDKSHKVDRYSEDIVHKNKW